MFLLTLCIGLTPLQTLNAGNLDHMEDMSANCVSCDMDGGADPDVCDGTKCTILAGSCGANSISSISQETPWSSMASLCLSDYLCSITSLYQSHLNFPIYRPPIA
jgi:hypothetical protein